MPGSGPVSEAILTRSERVSVILPVFAEDRTVPEILDRLAALLGPALHEVRVVLSPKSPLGTVMICRDAARARRGIHVSVQKQSPGVGFAFRQGIDEAKGDLLLLMDSDGEMDVEDVPRMLTTLRASGADMVVGSRWIEGGGAEGYDAKKMVLNRAYHALFRTLYRTALHDLTFGFKLGRAAVLKSFRYTSQFQEIGCEVTLRALHAGYRVEEIPTVWRCRKQGVSTNPLKRNLRYAWTALSVLGSRRLPAIVEEAS
jgi:dolichol-phosphate mannosyltransferase